jgi:simple sugar transport system ATP-binding protein
VPDFTLTENIALHHLAARRGLMRWPTFAQRTTRLIEHFHIRAPGPGVKARTLSGGNQQRLVVARELEQNVELIVADNPTRGLDISATLFVHDQLRAAAAAGSAVIVHSADLDELLALATRMLVVFHGDVRAVPMDRDKIGRAMLGVA